jgi:type I restriction enzyme S subunit
MNFHKLDEFMVKRGGSVDPSKHKDETFELLSIPAFDKGSPEIVDGEQIGSSKKQVQPRDVLLSKIVPHIRRCWIVPQKSELRQIASGEWIQFRSDDVAPEYLRLFLMSDRFHGQFMKTVKGVGGSLLRASPAQVAEIEIPLPPLEDQIRIAHILGKVEALIAQRKQHLQQLDDLIKSVFLEMFGDPVRNEKGWAKKSCAEVAEIITGHPFKSDLYIDDPRQIRLCGGLIIYPHGIEWDKCNFWPEQLLPGLERYLLEINDIVLAMDRPWISSGLKMCMVDERGRGSLLVQRTARIRAVEVDQHFLRAHLKDLSFTRHCKPTETTVPHISIKDIQTFQVLCPPMDLQNEFTLIAKKIDLLKVFYERGLDDLESLYGGLSQFFFCGDNDHFYNSNHSVSASKSF